MNNSKQQGDVGVAMAIAHYTQKGFVVSVPLTDDARYDLVVDTHEKILRVQCKTTRFMVRDSYQVALRTFGGNRSWSGSVKKISAEECDVVFVYAFDGRCYEFTAAEIDGRSTITLNEGKQKTHLVWHAPRT